MNCENCKYYSVIKEDNFININCDISKQLNDISIFEHALIGIYCPWYETEVMKND